MPKPFTIAGREVGPGRPTFVIAEIGVNHDGDVLRAIELVDRAREAGADAIKLQLFSADRLMHKRAELATYQHDTCGDVSPAAMLRRYELPDAEVARIVEHAREIGLVPIATPFSPEDVERVAAFELPAVKLASPDLVNPLLIDAVAELGLPMILSSGAATREEVQATISRLSHREASFALLHCVSSYPTSSAAAHLAWIRHLADDFDIVTGLSDHTQELLTGAIAVACGASIIEKHLTHDRYALGPDHAASADPWQFAQYVDAVRLAEQMLGSGGKHVLAEEQDVRRVSRQSLVLRRAVSAGEPITRELLTCMRPGTGIPAAELDDVVGRRATRDLPAGTMLAWDDIQPPENRIAA